MFAARGIQRSRYAMWVCCLGALLLVYAPSASAAPVFGEIFRLNQPDGSQIEVRIWGDEFYGVTETLDGYTVVRDPDTMYFCYAQLSADGNDLLSTGVVVGHERAGVLGIAPHIRINPESARAKVQAARAEWDAELAQGPRAPSTGDVLGITVIIQFPDEAGTITRAQVQDHCNLIGYTAFGNNGSVHDYYADVSGGVLNYTNWVSAYYTADHDKSYYTDESVDWGIRTRELATEALDDLEANGHDFTAYDSDGDGFVDACNFYYCGDHGNQWAEGLWPGAFSFSWSADGKTISRMQMTNMSGALTIGTFCHENGHMLMGWPDLYDYDEGADDSAGVGKFCIMCNKASSTNPVEPCAPLKMRAAGWTTTNLLTTCQAGLSAPAGANTLFKFEHPTNVKEYYVTDNRQQTGRDANIPDSGLAIWHVDEDGSNDNQEMTPALHYEVTLGPGRRELGPGEQRQPG